MWGEILMNASWLISSILAIVGIMKLFFKKFKEKHPKWYKFTFFMLSLVLIAGGSILAELYVLEGTLASVEFALLLLVTAAGVIGGYTGYECTNLKDGVNQLFTSLKNWFKNYPETKAAKIVEGLTKEVNKLVEKAGGIDNVVTLYNDSHIKEVEIDTMVQETQLVEAPKEDQTEKSVAEVQVVIEEK